MVGPRAFLRKGNGRCGEVSGAPVILLNSEIGSRRLGHGAGSWLVLVGGAVVVLWVMASFFPVVAL